MLVPCDVRENERPIVLDALPRMDVFEDCLYVPQPAGVADAPCAWGVFGRDRRLLPGTGYARGPLPDLPLQQPTTPLDARDVPDWAEDDCLIYGGMLQGHYGHFLIGALSRFWNEAVNARRDVRVLVHGYGDVEYNYGFPFIGDCLGALGIGQERLCKPETPLRVRRLLVPHPSFEEMHLAHHAYAALGHRLGAQLAPGEPETRSDEVVYLSKHRVTRGVQSLVNEHAVVEVLAKQGVRIVCPEELRLAEQIDLFGRGRLIVGLSGSAFHTSIFRPASRLLVLEYTRAVRANYALIDAVNGNVSAYLHPVGALHAIAASDAFPTNWVAESPTALAEAILRAIEAFPRE